MFILWAVLFGVLVGWAASLVMRTATNEGILIDIAAVCLGQFQWRHSSETMRLWTASWQVASGH